jgi:hypothetical protein
LEEKLLYNKEQAYCFSQTKVFIELVELAAKEGLVRMTGRERERERVAFS